MSESLAMKAVLLGRVDQGRSPKKGTDASRSPSPPRISPSSSATAGPCANGEVSGQGWSESSWDSWAPDEKWQQHQPQAWQEATWEAGWHEEGDWQRQEEEEEAGWNFEVTHQGADCHFDFSSATERDDDKIDTSAWNLTSCSFPNNMVPGEEMECFFHGPDGQSGRFVLQLPRSFRNVEGEKWPLLVYMPGSGKQSLSSDPAARHHPGLQHARNKFAVLSVIPTWDWRGQPASWAEDLVRELAEAPWVDPRRITICGASMGGMGTLMLGARLTDVVAGLAVVCSHHHEEEEEMLVRQLADIPLLILHSRTDSCCKLEKEEAFWKRLQTTNQKLLICLNDDSHEQISERAFYHSTQLYDFLLKHQRVEATDVADTREGDGQDSGDPVPNAPEGPGTAKTLQPEEPAKTADLQKELEEIKQQLAKMTCELETERLGRKEVQQTLLELQVATSVKDRKLSAATVEFPDSESALATAHEAPRPIELQLQKEREETAALQRESKEDLSQEPMKSTTNVEIERPDRKAADEGEGATSEEASKAARTARKLARRASKGRRVAAKQRARKSFISVGERGLR